MDESGHSQDAVTRLVGIAGLVAPLEKWEAFTVSWQEALDSFSLKQAFHMKDFAHSAGQCSVGWKKQKTKERRSFRKIDRDHKSDGRHSGRSDCVA
jgi:hypothetical protein